MTARRARRTAAVAVTVATVVALPASAVTGSPVTQLRLLWATVNVCDTEAHPDAIGLRASMPGDGVAADEMYVRFQAQYLSPKDGLWRTVSRGADSGFVDLGSARARVRETGRMFAFATPSNGGFELRGLITFEWRSSDGTVVHRARRLTTAGHRSSAGADPQGFSADSCLLT